MIQYLGFPGGAVVKNLPANTGDVDSVPGSGRSPGVGNVTYRNRENKMKIENNHAYIRNVEKF